MQNLRMQADPNLAVKSWQPYQPSDAAPWNLARVWTLHRRTCFAATWAELQRDLASSPGEAVERIVGGTGRLIHGTDDFESTSDVIRDAAIASMRPERLRSWWVFRMYFTRHPLAERMSILWHNHFATSNLSIQNLQLMANQNQIFRECALAPFPEMLDRVIRDPTMLIWLNADDNRESHPNENLGRELLELFTLGIGHYGEDDVKEAARALTGWTVRENKFFYRHFWHDAGEKTVLGKTGRWTGDDILRIVLEHPATAERLAWRLCDEFFGEGVVTPTDIHALADGLRNNGLDIRWALKTILNSRLFNSEANIRTRIAEPENFVLSLVRMVEFFDPPASTLALAEWMRQMGRDLFYPPNVGGWDGGRTWLNPRTVVARSNYVNALLFGRMNRQSSPPDLDTLVSRHTDNEGLDAAVRFLSQLLLGIDPANDRINEMFQRTVRSVEQLHSDRQAQLSAIVETLLTTSAAQLC